MPDSFRPASLAIVCWIAACVFACAHEASVLDSETKKSESGIGIRKLAERYEIQNATSNEKLRLVDHPVLSWTNPERNTSAGALFLWTLQSRPKAAMCIYPTGPNNLITSFNLSARNRLRLLSLGSFCGVQKYQGSSGRTCRTN